MLIGLTGAAGSGKGSVASLIMGRAGWVEIAFADPLYAAVEAITGISQAKLKDRVFKEQPIDWLGKSPRQILQTLGTDYGRKMISDSIWVDRAMHQVDENDASGLSTVIADVRFDNEAEAVRARGGVVWEVLRPAASCLVGEAARHESESGIRRDLVDLTLWNDGTLEELAGNVDAALRETLAVIL